MTRRQKRYERRKAARDAKREAFLKQYDNFDIVCSRKNLFASADLAKKRVMWKGSVQRWSINQLLETERLYRDLKAGKDVRKGFSRFIIYERGKKRNISAVRFYERVVQKCLCQNILLPVYCRSLIYDNAASQKNKGTKFATDRMTLHLKRHFNRNGVEGYALLVDFKGYFDNINHDVAKLMYRKYFSDERLLKLIDDFIDAYGEKGLGLGSETSQMHAIKYPDMIDHAVSETHQGILFYGRYMDDSYIISKDKSVLVDILAKIKALCEKLKIILSPKKTTIVKIKNGLRWLKTNFYLTSSGKIIRKPCRQSAIRQRRKMKKQIRLYKEGLMNKAQIVQSFESWAGSLKRRNARLVVFNMRLLLRGIE